MAQQHARDIGHDLGSLTFPRLADDGSCQHHLEHALQSSGKIQQKKKQKEFSFYTQNRRCREHKHKVSRRKCTDRQTDRSRSNKFRKTQATSLNTYHLSRLVVCTKYSALPISTASLHALGVVPTTRHSHSHSQPASQPK
jgi:hypothetical protein